MADFTHEFDVGSFLQANGLKYVDAIDPNTGILKVKDSSGVEHEFNAAEAVKSVGGDPSTTKLANINTPSTAIAQSPVGIEDRVKLAVGNQKGSIAYLKNKFSAVEYDKDKGIVVNQNGAWYQVDPSFLDAANPWEATKELAKDVLTKGPKLAADVAAMEGGAALGALGGPAGIVAGVGAASALAAGIKTSLGRAWGTYQATPEEEMLDNGVETLLAMGGQKLLMGMEPTAKHMAAALSKLASETAPAVKGAMAQIYSMLSGVTKRGAQTVLEDAAPIAKDIAINSETALQDQAISATKAALEKMENILPRLYRESSAELIKSSEGKLGQVKLGEMVGQSLDDMVLNGKLVKRPIKGAEGKFRFDLPSDEEIVALRNGGIQAPDLSAEARQQLEPIIKKMNTWATTYEDAGGSKAATLMLGLRKDLNEMVRTKNKDGLTDTTKQLLYSFGNSFKGRMGAEFEKAGLADKYVATSEAFKRYGETAEMAQNLLNRQAEGGLTTFLTHIMKDMKNSRFYSGMEGQMREILGPEGNKLLDTAVQKYSAAEFSGLIPKGGLQKILATGTLANPMGTVSKAAALTAMSPRAQLAAAQAAQGAGSLVNPAIRMAADASWKAKDFVLGLAPEQVKLLANDPQSMSALINSIGQQTQLYDNVKNGLINQVTGGRK